MKIVIDKILLDKYFQELLENDSAFHWDLFKTAWSCIEYEMKRRGGVFYENEKDTVFHER